MERAFCAVLHPCRGGSMVNHLRLDEQGRNLICSTVHFVVALISENSIGSSWCAKELSLAMTQGLARDGVKVLPARVGNVEMPAALADLPYVQVDPNDIGSFSQRLVKDARQLKRDAALHED
jgi:hypothetical protein